MELILAIVISFVAGVALGFFYQKAKSQKTEVELEFLRSQKAGDEAQWQRLREESINNAKAVMFETSKEISAKLIDDHKRENLESRKMAEEITKKETETLHREFEKVVKQLDSLTGQHQGQDKKLAAIWQSLTSPVKAANFAEIGLENTLKNFGLEAGVDFHTQTALEGTGLRPDAIINLPSGNRLVIDAKTSKFFIEISAAEDDAEILKTKLKASMNTHLTGLARKDYAVAGKDKLEGSYIVNVMYLPNDAAYGRVLECDSCFEQKCREAGVLLVTPTSLHMLLSIATHQIARARQEQNHQQILDGMGKVISSVDNLLRGLNEVGVNIRRTADAFAKLSGPINSRVIPRIKNVLKLGLKPEREVKLPEALPSFNIIENEAAVFELEADNVDNVRSLEKKAG